MYNKQRNKKIAAFAGAAVCVIMIMSVFVQMNPKAVERFMQSTGKLLSNLFSGYSSVQINRQTEASESNENIAINNTETSEVTEAADTTKGDKKQKSSTDSNEIISASPKDIVPDDTTQSEQTTDLTKNETYATIPEMYEPADQKSAVAQIKYVSLGKGKIRVTVCVPTGSTVIIPGEIDGHTVTQIGENVFQNNNTVTGIVLPDTVTEICANAFKGLENLKSVKMPKNIKTIGASAFEGCSGLEPVNLKKVESIGAKAFMNCSSLTELSIPASVKTIEDAAFRACKALKTVIIAKNIKSIPDYAFYQCGALKNLSLPTSLRSIGCSAFGRCAKLENVIIPNGVQTINKQAFYRCSGLKSVSLPETLRGIKEEAFYCCESLVGITVPSGVLKLGDMCLGYYEKKENNYYNDVKTKDFTIKCYVGSAAYTYVVNNGFNVVNLGKVDFPTSVYLDKYIVELSVGSTYEIGYSVENPNGKTTFTTDSPDVAKVSSDGKVTAIKVGAAKITVENNGVSRKLVVIVE